MLLSSDEEIIVRKSKVSKKRNLENLFDSEEQSEEFSMIEEEYSDNLAYNRPVSSKLFVEIFGTGKEYLYAMENLSSIPEEKIIKEFEKPKRKLTEDMLSFLIENLEDVTYSVLKTVSELILDGACVEYLVIGKPELNLDISLGYKIFDLIEYYFNNLSVIEKLKKTGKLNLKYLNLISKKEFVNEGNQFVLDDTNLYKILTKNNLIINKNKFKENILEKERIYAPDDIENEDPLIYINTNFLKEKSASKTEIINYLANEFSKDTLLKDSIINLIINSAYLEINNKTILFTEIIKNSFYDLILELRNNNYKILFDLFSVLNNFFINNNFSSKWNDFRKEIIQRFIKKFDYENILRTRFLDNFKEIGRKALGNNIIDRVVNGRVAHCNYYFGVTVEKFNLKCSVVDYTGELREFRLINLNDRSSLSDLMDAYGVNELFISDTTPKSKKTFQNLDFNLKYVESNLIKRYSNSKNFTQNIVRMIISPETELAYMVNKGLDLTNALLEPIIPNKELLIQTDLENIKGFNEPCENEPNEFFFVEFLSVKEREEVIRRSLQTALSIVGVDINIILHNERRRNLVDFMPGFYISDKLKEFNFIERINILESALEGDKSFNFRNAATFLRAYIEKGDKLDEFSIHPYTYKYARMVCAAARDKTETDDINLSADVKEYLEKGMSPSFDIQKVSHMKEVYDTFVFALGVLNQTNKYFEGLPDKLIFNDLIGEYKLGVYEGMVVESQKSFAIVSVKDSFSVFVRKNFDQTYYYNQIVKVRILEKNIQFLSFSGEIISEEKKETNNLEVVQDTFYIRKSKKNDFYYLFINLEENLLYPLKLEYVNDKILVLEKYFDDLEELKVKFIRPVFLLLNKIKKNEFFFNSQKEAELFINKSKEQIKYAFYLSREYPGRIVFEFDNGKLHKEYLKLANKLIYNNKVFNSLEEFLEYRKSI